MERSRKCANARRVRAPKIAHVAQAPNYALRRATAFREPQLYPLHPLFSTHHLPADTLAFVKFVRVLVVAAKSGLTLL